MPENLLSGTPRERLAAKLAMGLKGCRFDVVSSRLAPAKGGWKGSFVIVGAAQGIDDKRS